jgi:RNA polymerase sigma-70 factor, ECF subfamily
MAAPLLTLPFMLGDARRAPLRAVSGEGEIVAEREAAAIARLVEGDVEALGILYDLHHAHVRTFARRYLGDHAAAEDLVHDAFLALVDAAPRLRAGAPLRSYVIGIAVNLARHHLRSARRRRDAMGRLAVEPPHQAPTPEQAAVRDQLSVTLQRALDRLSDDHRAAIVLCEIEERSGPEVAAILGIPEATVRTRLFHAKRKLREALEGEP